jgi:hypothetical protein
MEPTVPRSHRLASAFDDLVFDIEFGRGHDFLYEPFGAMIAQLEDYRRRGGVLDERLTLAVFDLAETLIRENHRGRRPWAGGWECWFSQCMDNALRVLDASRRLEDFSERVPSDFSGCVGYLFEPGCFDELPQLVLIGARIYAWTAGQGASFHESWLDHPDDDVFTLLLTGMARSAPGRERIRGFLDDDEAWVRTLARRLLACPPQLGAAEGGAGQTR